ncbi:MAG: flagellar basal body P-ring formation chaperone FlgA [Methylobacter sp.]|uniref:flagellar basal body P-ring formation chaperone FlgA n=1 Tax=Methylobacter sp. TaxID=2051955 RepID=UPI00271FBB6E|nr:flagellar basal body P-ring formation chaperone FlgA [Methylobacter sp.]MDO9267727.1 flagellar basal body P-ring formation chaperone FlgA [Methylobacter sp.]MDP1665078.1 flagellar basal body P-ring formation chaperone FlgA [Methylobacter sp.]
MIKNTSLILALTFILFTAAHAEQSSQSHQSIAEAVKDYVEQNIHLSGEYEVTLTPLDSRLNLPQCVEPLDVFTTTALIKAGRTTIGVRCNAGKKWSIFTSVIIKTYQMVVVLSQPIQRGEIITQQHLAIEKREVSKLREDFVTQLEQVENKQVTRQLNIGTILSLRNIVEPNLVKRGDKVVISTTKPDFSIRMSGIAMMDGTKGQLITVKNQNSGRIINATVIEPGLVAVKY